MLLIAIICFMEHLLEVKKSSEYFTYDYYVSFISAIQSRVYHNSSTQDTEWTRKCLIFSRLPEQESQHSNPILTTLKSMWGGRCLLGCQSKIQLQLSPHQLYNLPRDFNFSSALVKQKYYIAIRSLLGWVGRSLFMTLPILVVFWVKDFNLRVLVLPKRSGQVRKTCLFTFGISWVGTR